MRAGLGVVRVVARVAAGLLPVAQGFFDPSGGAAVAGQDFGRPVAGDTPQEQIGDRAVGLAPGPPEQRLVGRVMDERVTEHVGGVWRSTRDEQDLLVDQAAEMRREPGLVEVGTSPVGQEAKLIVPVAMLMPEPCA